MTKINSVKINSFGFAQLNNTLYEGAKNQQNPQGQRFLLHAEQVFAFPGIEAAITAANAGDAGAMETLLNAIRMFRPANFAAAVEVADILSAPHRREAALVLSRHTGRDFADYFRIRGATDVLATIRGAKTWTPGYRPGDMALISVAALWRLLTWAPPAQAPAPPPAPVAEPTAAPAPEPATAAPAPAEQTETPRRKAPAEPKPRKPRSAKR